MENFDYHFVKRNSKETALNLSVIYKDLGYSKIDKNKLSKLYEITNSDINDKYYINKLLDRIENMDLNNQQKIKSLSEQLNERWANYKTEYLNIIQKALDIEIDDKIINHTYCYLHSLPINEISLKDGIIYLNYNEDIDKLFTTFIIMLTKLVLINRWNYVNNWDFNKEFDSKNKVLIFAEIAVDSVFYNSDLSKLSNKVSYKYFYSLEIEGVNIMEYFRKLYLSKPLDEYFTDVYMFVHQNYKSLLQFKNYLY